MDAEKALDDLIRWIEVWNRVCVTAWGDDDKPPPSWKEVVAQELSDWNIGEMSANGWDAYMKQRLYHEVENYLYAIGRHPYQAQGLIGVPFGSEPKPVSPSSPQPDPEALDPLQHSRP